MSYELKSFWDKVDIKSTDECWEWNGGLHTKDGYGETKYVGNNIYEKLAHRIAWILHHQKEIPKGLLICHTCNNKRCVNPSHLYAGTHGDNNVDTFNAGHCGSGRPLKFKEGELWLMQRMRDKIPARIIAKCFKTTILTIYRNTVSNKIRQRQLS
jgi:hypothetical protein